MPRKRFQHGGLSMKRRNFLKAAAVGGAAARWRRRRSRSRAEGAVAADLGLPALARHHLRRGRDLRRACEGDDRRQLRDRGVPGRRDRADAAGRRGGRHRHRRDGAHLLLLLLGQGPDLRASARRCPFGLNARLMNAWLYEGGGNEPAQRLLRQAQPLRHARRQHRRADGRLVAQGDQLASRTCRASRCASPASPARWWRSSAWCRSRSRAATSIRRSSAARSTRPSGSDPTTTRSSASTRWRPTTTTRASGRAGRRVHFFVNLEKWNALSPEYQAILTNAAAYANTDMMAKYDARNPVALRSLIAGGAKLKAFPADVIDAAYLAAHEVYDEISAENADFKTIYRQRQGVPQRGLPLEPGGGIHLRHLHDPQPDQGLSGTGRLPAAVARQRGREGAVSPLSACAANSPPRIFTDRRCRGLDFTAAWLRFVGRHRLGSR